MMLDDTELQRRAAHARSLLEDPLLRTFFESAKQEIFSEWSAATDPAAREDLWQQQRALDALQAYLHSNLAAVMDNDLTERPSGRRNR